MHQLFNSCESVKTTIAKNGLSRAFDPLSLNEIIFVGHCVTSLTNGRKELLKEGEKPKRFV